jgi:uncharacterized membrane protein YphA (DoxX/SURF4 family)
MDVLLLCVRIVLATVFLTSGLGKLRDREATVEAARGFGLPHSVGRAAGMLLPLVEVAIGATTALRSTARFAAGAACLLLVAFNVLVLRALARAEDVSCNCFGASTTPVTWRTAARNGILLALATFAVIAAGADGRLAEWQWLPSGLRPLAAVAAPLLLALLAGHALRLRARRPPSAEVLDFPVEALDGSPVRLASLLQPGLPVALLFMDAGCHQCEALLPDLAEWRSWRSRLRVAILIGSGRAAAEAKFGALGVPVLLDRTLDVGISLGVEKRPTGVLIRPHAPPSPPAHGVAAIRRLIAPLAPAARR